MHKIILCTTRVRLKLSPLVENASFVEIVMSAFPWPAEKERFFRPHSWIKRRYYGNVNRGKAHREDREGKPLTYLKQFCRRIYALSVNTSYRQQPFWVCFLWYTPQLTCVIVTLSVFMHNSTRKCSNYVPWIALSCSRRLYSRRRG